MFHNHSSASYEHTTPPTMAEELTTFEPTTLGQIIAPSRPHDLNLFRKICELGFAFPISLLGIFGNIITIIALAKSKKKRTSSVVLIALAVVDTFVLLSTILLRSSRYLHPALQHQPVYHYLFRWLYPITYYLRLTETWLTVLLTVDRFIVVCYPFRAARLCTLRRTYVIIAVILCMSLCFSFPRFFECTVLTTANPATNRTDTVFRFTRMTENVTYTVAYRMTAYFFVMYLMPMICLIVLNSCLVYSLQKAQRVRYIMTRVSNRRENTDHKSITLIVVCIVTICIISNLLSMTSHIMWSVAHMSKYYYFTLDVYRRYLSNVSNVMVTLNSAVNFIFYYMWKKDIWDSWKSTCCRNKEECADGEVRMILHRGRYRLQSTQPTSTESPDLSTRRSTLNNFA